MSIEVPAAHFSPGATNVDDLKIARNDFIEAHNVVDAAIRAKLISFSVKPQPLVGQNVEALRKIEPSPQYSKAEKTKVGDLLNRFAPLQSLRCDLVHGLMDFAAINGEHYALFANVQSQPLIGRKVVVLTLTQLREGIAELNSLAREFRGQRGSTG